MKAKERKEKEAGSVLIPCITIHLTCNIKIKSCKSEKNTYINSLNERASFLFML